MSKSGEIDLIEICLKAQKQARKAAIDTAARTGTSLIFWKNGKVVREKPPYKYVRVSTKKRSSIKK